MGEGAIVGGHVAFGGTGDGEYQVAVALQQLLLDARQDLVGVAVEAGPVLGRLGIGQRLVAAVEQVVEVDAPAAHVLLEASGDSRRASRARS